MGFLFRVVAVLLLAGIPVGAAILMIDARPLVTRADVIDLDDLKRARSLAERYDPRRMPPERLTLVRATTGELNTLLKGAFAGMRRIASRVESSRFGILAAVTLALPVPENPIGRYLNFRTLVVPSQSGLEIARFAVGSVEIPPVLVRPALRLALDRVVGAGKGAPILDSVKSVELAGDRITLAFRPPPDLAADIKNAAKRYVTVSDPGRVRAYYEAVDAAVSGVPARGRISLARIMRPVFRLAQQRSAAGDPVRENEAAMLALAIYFGDSRFERFVGEVRPASERSRRRPTGHFRLDGRHDFVQHFTTSIGLALSGGDTAANIIGEFKEAKDSQKRSGFSFTDLGADRAGVRFARRATESAAAARRVQDVVAGEEGERGFFPHFADLPEGMSEAAFRRRYGDVGSAEYRRLIREIDRRILATSIYR